MVTGQYVAPNAGKVTFREYAEQWRASQVHRASTRAYVETMLRRHAYPILGDLRLGTVLPSQIQAWVAGLALAPSTATTLHGVVAGIFKAAVRDRRIAANPCEGSRLPRGQPRRVEPPTTEQVQALIAASAGRARAALVLAAGAGLRQGEVLGLTVDRVDFLRRTVRIDRQLVTLAGGPRFGPPKTAASNRTVPLPSVVIDALAEHLREHPAGVGLDGHRLVFTTGRHAVGPVALRASHLATRGQCSRPERVRVPLTAPLLRVVAHPTRRVRQDGAGATRARHSGRDAGHLQPSLAGLGGPHSGRCRPCSRGNLCGLLRTSDGLK